MAQPDPAYELFRKDAEAQGFESFAEYCRHYGIDIPDRHKSVSARQRERSMSLDRIERLESDDAWTSRFAIDKSWGESGTTIRVMRSSGDGDEEPCDD